MKKHVRMNNSLRRECVVRLHIITRICLALPNNAIFPNSYKSAIKTNIVMRKTSQVESFSILLMKPNLRIEL